MECEAYHSLFVEPMRKAMLKKMITKKEDIGGNFVIPCNVGGLKYMDALIDQGSDVNVMPLSTYNRITNEKLLEIDIRLSLASQSRIQPLGISEDVLVEIASFIYLLDFVILDIKEDRRKPFILGTPFLTTAKAEIRKAHLLEEKQIPSVEVEFFQRLEAFVASPIGCGGSNSEMLQSMLTHSFTLFGDCMDLSAISIVILIGFRLPSPNLLNKEYGITLILAPRSSKALLIEWFPIVQGRMKLPGSLSFGGSLF
ncbi:reverse transcriptase domain-containing protein [Tanacetum coccineum]